MSAMQPYTPLRDVEAMLFQNRASFKSWKDGSISFRVPSLLPLTQRIEYTIGLAEDKEGIVGLVMFGLPLSKESLEALAEELNARVRDVTFHARPALQILTVGMALDFKKLNQHLSTFYEACDFFYPLIMKIRAERSWSPDLLTLYFLPAQCMAEA